jgi:glucuronate isomerase
MTNTFLSDDFLLDNQTAKLLYFDYAAKMPIYDYHSHLPVKDIAEDRQFRNLAEIWLYGDHYKWRAMRTHGIDERFITGDASDFEKFQKWAQTVPYCIGNPLYHWTHLELKRYFGIDKILCEESAEEIFEITSQKLQTKEFSTRNLLRKGNVKLVCTTEDPLDNLEYHKAIRKDGFEISIHTTFRPDKAMQVENITEINRWIEKLRQITNVAVKDFQSYIEALRSRHKYFNENGCRLSDHGIDRPYAEEYTPKEIETIFASIIKGREINQVDRNKFKSAMMHEFALMDYESGWAQQFHIGAIRDNNTRMFTLLGPDTGYDSIGDFEIAAPLAKFLDRLAQKGQLAKTIIYNLNPSDNEVIATMIGNFQDGTAAGKMQFGPAWWFLDNKDGIENHLKILANMGLLSHFTGMLTDSRSFLSFTRHEYFRRILCNFLGIEVESDRLPDDIGFLGKIVQDICYNNAKNYFNMSCPD